MALVRDPDYAPAAALLAYDYALIPLFALSLRGGIPEEERKIVEHTIPMSDELARHATALDPKSAEAFVALGYANLVQKRMAAAEDAFKRALAVERLSQMHQDVELIEPPQVASLGFPRERTGYQALVEPIPEFLGFSFPSWDRFPNKIVSENCAAAFAIKR
jgi:hypothetical protein